MSILGKETYAYVVTLILTIGLFQLTGYVQSSNSSNKLSSAEGISSIETPPANLVAKKCGSENHDSTGVLPQEPISSLPYKPVVAVYGGSVTLGHNLINQTADRYATLLQEMMKDSILVVFHGIGGTGPEMHIVCGIPPADVIVSEFTVNESRQQVYDRWYEVAEENAQHTVILSLWTWLNPPNETNPLSVPILSLRDTIKTHPTRRQTFSVLSMELQQLWDWRKLVPKYFPRHPPKYKAEVKVCLEKAASIDPSAQEAFVQCGKSIDQAGTNHGTEPYHYDLATYLVRHLQDVVFPLLDPEKSWVKDDQVPTERHSRHCTGEWGPPGHYQNWTEAIERQVGKFDIGMWQRDKRTLRTNDPTGQVSLKCPTSSFQSARLGYIATNVRDHIAIFSVNGQNVSTALAADRYNYTVHIMEFSKAFQPPLEIAVVDLAGPKAMLQLALLACSHESIDQFNDAAS